MKSLLAKRDQILNRKLIFRTLAFILFPVAVIIASAVILMVI